MHGKREMSTGIKVFFSYAHQDKQLCEKLETYLIQLKRLGPINTWYNRDINAGSDWKREIERHLNTAQIILLLVSPDFIASDHCFNVEMKRAIERHKSGEVLVIPILLRPGAFWENTPLHQLQVLPTNRKPITAWHPQEKGFSHVAEEIRKAIQELQGQSKSQKDKLQEKSKDIVSPHNKKTDHPGVAPPVHNKKPCSPAIPPDKPAQSGQQSNNQTNNVFHGQVQAAISGGTNTIHFNTPMEDLIAKGRGEAQRAYEKLRHQDYVAAKRCLEAADLALSESKFPAESAQIKFYTAIALLNGQRPFSLTKQTMEHIDRLLTSAITLKQLHSYYYTLALFKRDFSRNGLLQYKRDAEKLRREAQHIKLTKTDKENLQVLTSCQPRLVDEAQHW